MENAENRESPGLPVGIQSTEAAQPGDLLCSAPPLTISEEKSSNEADVNPRADSPNPDGSTVKSPQLSADVVCQEKQPALPSPSPLDISMADTPHTEKRSEADNLLADAGEPNTEPMETNVSSQPQLHEQSETDVVSQKSDGSQQSVVEGNPVELWPLNELLDFEEMDNESDCSGALLYAVERIIQIAAQGEELNLTWIHSLSDDKVVPDIIRTDSTSPPNSQESMPTEPPQTALECVDCRKKHPAYRRNPTLSTYIATNEFLQADTVELYATQEEAAEGERLTVAAVHVANVAKSPYVMSSQFHPAHVNRQFEPPIRLGRDDIFGEADEKVNRPQSFLEWIATMARIFQDAEILQLFDHYDRKATASERRAALDEVLMELDQMVERHLDRPALIRKPRGHVMKLQARRAQPLSPLAAQLPELLSFWYGLLMSQDMNVAVTHVAGGQWKTFTQPLRKFMELSADVNCKHGWMPQPPGDDGPLTGVNQSSFPYQFGRAVVLQAGIDLATYVGKYKYCQHVEEGQNKADLVARRHLQHYGSNVREAQRYGPGMFDFPPEVSPTAYFPSGNSAGFQLAITAKLSRNNPRRGDDVLPTITETQMPNLGLNVVHIGDKFVDKIAEAANHTAIFHNQMRPIEPVLCLLRDDIKWTLVHCVHIAIGTGFLTSRLNKIQECNDPAKVVAGHAAEYQRMEEYLPELIRADLEAAHRLCAAQGIPLLVVSTLPPFGAVDNERLAMVKPYVDDVIFKINSVMREWAAAEHNLITMPMIAEDCGLLVEEVLRTNTEDRRMAKMSSFFDQDPAKLGSVPTQAAIDVMAKGFELTLALGLSHFPAHRQRYLKKNNNRRIFPFDMGPCNHGSFVETPRKLPKPSQPRRVSETPSQPATPKSREFRASGRSNSAGRGRSRWPKRRGDEYVDRDYYPPENPGPSGKQFRQSSAASRDSSQPPQTNRSSDVSMEDPDEQSWKEKALILQGKMEAFQQMFAMSAQAAKPPGFPQPIPQFGPRPLYAAQIDPSLNPPILKLPAPPIPYHPATIKAQNAALRAPLRVETQSESGSIPESHSSGSNASSGNRDERNSAQVEPLKYGKPQKWGAPMRKTITPEPQLPKQQFGRGTDEMNPKMSTAFHLRKPEDRCLPDKSLSLTHTTFGGGLINPVVKAKVRQHFKSRLLDERQYLTREEQLQSSLYVMHTTGVDKHLPAQIKDVPPIRDNFPTPESYRDYVTSLTNGDGTPCAELQKSTWEAASRVAQTFVDHMVEIISPSSVKHWEWTKEPFTNDPSQPMLVELLNLLRYLQSFQQKPEIDEPLEELLKSFSERRCDNTPLRRHWDLNQLAPTTLLFIVWYRLGEFVGRNIGPARTPGKLTVRMWLRLYFESVKYVKRHYGHEMPLDFPEFTL